MGVDVEAIFAAVPSPYVLLDRDLRIVWANAAYLEVTGRTGNPPIGKIITEEFPAPPDSLSEQMLQSSFQRVLESGRVDHLPLIPYPIDMPDGRREHRYWSATHSPIYDAEGRVEYILQNTNDITRLHQRGQTGSFETSEEGDLIRRAESVAQENLELGTATRFFQTVFDQAPSFIAILSEPDHVFRLVNDSYRQIVGPERDYIGLPVREALPEVEGQGFFEMLDQVYATGEPIALRGAQVFLNVERDAPPTELFIDFVYQPLRGPGGDVIGILVQGHDVTAQKQAERQLREAEERFRTMAQSMPSHVWTAGPDGLLDWVSDQVRAYAGTSDGDLLGEDWVRVLHPDDVARVAPIWTRAVATGETYETEFRLRRRDGTYRWHLTRAVPIHDEAGRVRRWIGSNTDIEDRKATEAALAELNATLEERVESRNRELEEVNATLRQSQKMEAIGNLAGGVAHDFNNLLQAITGSLQLAQRGLEADSPAAQRIDQAMQAVDRGATLAAQLLAFGRRQPLEPRATDLGRLLGEIDPILRSAVGEGIAIETRVASGLWNTLIDSANLENALLNLAVNARDAMEGRGRLCIEVENATLDAAYARAQSDVVPGEYVCLAVTDEGSGMTSEVIDKIFEPFFTTKPEGRGTGLGMAMVYGFVKQSGGHVAIDSRPGRGTTVRIYLPRSLRPEETAPPRVERPVAGGSETILLVEDDVAVRRTARDLLEDLGYGVIEAADADEGLAAIESGRDLDLLLTDVVMPGRLTSRQMAERAQALHPGLPVLFASGYSRDAIVHDGRLDEGIQLLRKPYRREVLAQRLRELLDAPGGAAPAPKAEAPKPAAPPRDPAAACAGLGIVVCEDDTFIRLDLVEMLEAAGAKVREAASGAQALDLLAAAPADLLLVDVGLPDLSGVEVARRAQGRQPGLPVIFATGRDRVDGAETVENAVTLTKPFGQDALLRAVAERCGALAEG
ncbi:PAS domain-containing protein [Limimaricola pyoseonensis]|uniref:histidine kinase n=1 Tax=Limimaricola pyoseonensis TaxID=521013 RepID=A0A1G7CM53_9RHOB|nr:PAS domain-containing protein [Limimaricola pyoseonensis]SDE40419.1 PAS domain S-box-containing protein [Limimaricola pyoseonensis]